MMTRRSRREWAFLTAALTVAALLTGCGGDDPAANAQSTEPEVDPRFASAEALIEYYNTLAAPGRPIDLRAILEEMSGETAEQEQLIDRLKISVPVIELEQLAFEKWGRPLVATEFTSPPLSPPRNLAAIVEGESQRARAEQLRANGQVASIYLVKLGGRWWISGYTLEYNSEIWGQVLPASAPVYRSRERGERAGARAAEAIIRRIKTGELSSYSEARQAMRDRIKDEIIRSGG